MAYKNMVLVFAAVVCGLTLLSPHTDQSQPDISPVCVAVRVFDGNRFVGDLALPDFELLEDGKSQRIHAVYLVNKNTIERSEGDQDYHPDIARRFYLLFQMFEYQAKLLEAIRYLFNEELVIGDTVEIQTPMRNYRLSPAAFEAKPKDVLAEAMNDIAKKDILQGSMVYNGLLTELKRLVRRIGSGNPMAGLEIDTETEEIGLPILLMQCKQSLQKLEALRTIEESKLVRFAQALKVQPGQKFIFFIYQREYRPEISPLKIHELTGLYQDQPNIISDVQELFQYYHRDISLNTQALKETFADSGAILNFLFMNKTPEKASGIVMKEKSEDVFKAFTDISRATGGIVDTSQNPAAAIKNTLKTSEKYYLVYYTPESFIKDGTFKNIQVRIKDKDYRVVNRLGYIQN